MKSPISSIRLGALVALLAVVAPALRAQSPWLPEARHLDVTPRYIYQSFRGFWMGSHDARLDDRVTQHTAAVTAEYGICDFAAADVTIGYSHVSSTAFGGVSESDDGLSDTQIGLRFRLLDENRASNHLVPTLTLRVGGIIAGTYTPFRPFSAGDGAHGGEASLMFGKTIPGIGTGLYGEAGYRVRGSAHADGMRANVPNDFFGSIGVFQPIGPCVLSFGYRHIQALSGSDIGDPGFTFPGVKEVNQLLEAGLGFRDRGNRYYQIFGAWNVDGRNTGDKTILAASVTFPF